MTVLRPIPGFPGYSASANGGIWSHFRSPAGRRSAGGALGSGYRQVRLRQSGKSITVRVHILVCTAFHGERPGPSRAWHVAHGNGNKEDNRACNLRWATAGENLQESYRHGTHPTKLTRADVAYIRKSTKTRGELAAALGVTKGHITRIRKRRLWKN